MKTINQLLSLAFVTCCFFFAASTASFAQVNNPFGGTIYDPTPIKSSDPRVVEFSKLPELKGLKIDMDNVHEVHDDGTGKGCIIFPIKVPVVRGSETDATYCWVYYDLKKPKTHVVIHCYTKGTRNAAGGATANVVLKDADGVLLCTLDWSGESLPISSGGTEATSGVALSITHGGTGGTARSYGECVDNNYSGAKGTFAGAAAGGCISLNVFACAASVGWLAGTLIGCAL